MTQDAKYDAVVFDLLGALIDSWTLWIDVAGSAEKGRRWRETYLERSLSSNSYRPYTSIIEEAARDSPVPESAADELVDRWGELSPWPEVPGVLGELQRRGVPMGIATNCSETLGRQAASLVGVEFDTVVTAERAGWYKPNPQPYELAIRELETPADRTLFVAGSSADIPGASSAGMPVVWHNRKDAPQPEEEPLATFPTLDPLVDEVFDE